MWASLLLGKAPVGRKVAVIGGGLTGCEVAYELYLQGKEPVIVEMQEDRIAADGITVVSAEGEESKLNVDSVILSVGYKPTPPIAARTVLYSIS